MKLDLVRVTEAGAISASKFIGSGDKLAADGAATEAMKKRMEFASWTGIVKIGEGRKDDAPGLFCGDVVGRNWREDDATRYEIAIDPVDGTTQTVNGGTEAISVIAIAKPGMMWDGMVDGKEQFYMLKLAFGPSLMEAKLKITDPLEEIIFRCSKALHKPIDRLMVCMLNRPRHKVWIDLMRKMGVRIKLIQDCDVSGAIATCRPESGVDLYYGIGGAPEAVLAASALRCLGGDFQAIAADGDANISGKVFNISDLINGPCAFAATGILDGSMLKGVRVENGKYVTHSVFMRSESGTVRWITTNHGN